MGAATVYLGQFTWEASNAIAARLEKAGITWWHKQAGAIARFVFMGDWGVRLFVERERLDEAREIVRSVLESAPD